MKQYREEVGYTNGLKYCEKALQQQVNTKVTICTGLILSFSEMNPRVERYLYTCLSGKLAY